MPRKRSVLLRTITAIWADRRPGEDDESAILERRFTRSDDTPEAEFAMIAPFEYADPETGDLIAVSSSPLYSKIRVNDKEYYFIRETGEFDGTGSVEKPTGPILV